MDNQTLGRTLIGAAAVSTIVVPIGVDAGIFGKAHMDNPRWLPHAKLHTAMSFHAALAMGATALGILATRPAADRGSMRLAAFSATAFWGGLIAAGAWPDTAYDFKDDPDIYIMPPRVAGIRVYENVAASIVSIAIGWAGYALLARAPLSSVGLRSRSRAVRKLPKVDQAASGAPSLAAVASVRDALAT